EKSESPSARAPVSTGFGRSRDSRQPPCGGPRIKEKGLAGRQHNPL
ncbi:MAG: hypothetical protein, partial [Olavius algarvensis Gamma 1 endosymbiont]